jgi:hypothetical protein
MVKLTFTLDDETVARLRREARRRAKPQSAIVREAVAEYAARASDTDRDARERLILAIDDVLASAPARPARDVAREIRDVRAARRAGGRRTR